eukprot:TRINITY_DN112101_c0_g1_i1.p1 TRINITY_DN112101_c0_g1~~TRINITY_DN112101_c0_g1_i1.p1  ORF type:complete len:580 (-),score=54.24 TRINITY_DN112101_c0_g1_i1:406-2145(-)
MAYLADDSHDSHDDGGGHGQEGSDAVVSFLGGLGLGLYAENFLEQGYDDIDVLCEMSDADMSGVGMKPGHKLKLKVALKSQAALRRLADGVPAEISPSPAAGARRQEDDCVGQHWRDRCRQPPPPPPRPPTPIQREWQSPQQARSSAQRNSSQADRATMPPMPPMPQALLPPGHTSCEPGPPLQEAFPKPDRRLATRPPQPDPPMRPSLLPSGNTRSALDPPEPARPDPLLPPKLPPWNKRKTSHVIFKPTPKTKAKKQKIAEIALPPEPSEASELDMEKVESPPEPSTGTEQEIAEVAPPPEPLDRQATYSCGDAVLAYSKTEQEWLDATVVGLKDGINFRIKWADGDCEETLSFLELRHKPGVTRSKRDRSLVRDERVTGLQALLPYALHGLNNREDILMTWRSFRIIDGVALDREDPKFLEGPAACVANSYDFCRKLIEDAGGSLFLHKLAELHAGTFGIGASKFLGQTFQEFVEVHFFMDGLKVSVSESKKTEDAVAVKRRSKESDARLRNAIIRCCQANNGAWTFVKALVKDPAVLEALSDIPSRTLRRRRITDFVLNDYAFKTSKSGNTIQLA